MACRLYLRQVRYDSTQSDSLHWCLDDGSRLCVLSHRAGPILSVLWDGRPKSVEDMKDAVWGDREDGGPLTASAIQRSVISHLRATGRAFGFTIEHIRRGSGPRCPGLYRLAWPTTTFRV